MKKLIFLILKKIKIDNKKLLKFYIKNKLELELKPTTTITSYCNNIEEFEELVDSVIRYLKCLQPGVLFNISKLTKKKVFLKLFYSNKEKKYVENIQETNLRILKKIQKIKEEYLTLDNYHSRNLKTHIIYIEDYLSVILL